MENGRKEGKVVGRRELGGRKENVKKERRKSIGTSFEGGFGSLLSIRIDKWFPTNAPGPQVLPEHS